VTKRFRLPASAIRPLAEGRGACFDIYDVNTIANYDPSIIGHLDAPLGSAFGRNEDGQLLPEAMPRDPDA
jgi:hypothetical protein